MTDESELRSGTSSNPLFVIHEHPGGRGPDEEKPCGPWLAGALVARWHGRTATALRVP